MEIMVGKRIKSIREELGMSQAEMAEKLGILPQTIYKYEKGIVTNIPISTIEAIAKLGNVSPTYIMGWDVLYKDDLQLLIDKLSEDQLRQLMGYAQALVDQGDKK